jgi:hypothetical protein
MKAARHLRREPLVLIGAILAVSISSMGCVTTKTVGDFPVFGTVVDEATGKPLQGAEVVLHYYGSSNFKTDNKYTEPVLTDSAGRFRIEPQKIRLWGGYGPLTGYIKEFPGLIYRMEGYCENSKAYMNPKVEKYQNMRLKLRRDDGTGCKKRVPPPPNKSGGTRGGPN